ncbi:hypothetical protein SAMD00019534_009830 [Acytostelium subglobosum LB1]|uniref:hypothetical protein n=1 Tax=Acytostelium subglobosum LB1 TaxID=1410327 RepID=UPI0006449058|nr:hypothetical protein SAMD00019534_009830 [Acytostelium subglobosum LB1]GAM17808.1 hypothetical protein SAMD00019534_009830 [Acytostelium subglobosum LB1]|eukprot:XP_012758404.1 hypothetical protein SAMD00019534_009830 [Acytostelium subglobosum LB1]
MKLFGKPKPNPAQTQETIAKLRTTIEMLEKRKKFLQQKADSKEVEAKQFVAKKKKREALLCLKQRNIYQNEVNKLQGTFDTLSTQIFALENAKMNEEILNSMRSGAQQLKVLQNNLTVEKVEDIFDDIQEQMDVHEEISRAISQPIGTQVEDEDDLLAELAELEQEELDAQLLSVKAPPSREPIIKEAPITFPAASKVKPRASEEDEEYRALEESLAM